MNRLPSLRGLMLPLATLPLFPAALFNLFTLRERALLGCVLGIALPWVATFVLRRGRRGDARKAALLVGAAAYCVVWLGAGAGPVRGRAARCAGCPCAVTSRCEPRRSRRGARGMETSWIGSASSARD